MVDLLAQFRQLTRPPTGAEPGARFAGSPIPGYETHRIAVDAEGFPALLVSVLPGDVREPPIVLDHVVMQQGIECRVSEPDGSVQVGRFTLIRCTGGDPLLVDYFLRIGSSVIPLLGSTPTASDVSGVISRLVELFRAVLAPPRKSVQGLWGELFVISRAADAPTLVRAWHADAEDRYDFSMGSQRLEIKTVRGRERVHHFSLDQVVPAAGTEVLIASLFVESAGAGTSLGELIEKARTNVRSNPELALKIDQIIGLTLGERVLVSLDHRFDVELAEESLRFYEASAIPTPNPDLPSEVSEVRFRSNISRVTPIELTTYREQGDVFAAALR